MQRGLGVPADGRIGPQTMQAAIGVRDGVKAIQRACAARLGFLQGLRTWKTFGRGWGRRVAGVEAEAVAMYTKSASAVSKEAAKATTDQRARSRDGAVVTVGGGSGMTFADIPAPVLYWAIPLVVVIVLIVGLKAIQHARRADAYRAKAMELINE